jgi:hypothetical protein
MPTLVLSRRYSDDSNALWRAAIEAGWDVERLMTYAPDAQLASREPVVYGETLLADAVGPPLDLVLLEPSHGWLPRLPAAYRKREVCLTTLADARSLAARRFVKPVDEKVFAAGVYDDGSGIDPTCDFPDSSGVLIAQPVCFGFEARAFVLERSVASLSAYVRGGEIARDAAGEWPLSEAERAGAMDFLARMLADPAVELPAAVVVDVGLMEEGWAVVEANACWASGLCGCDPREVLKVIRRASVPAARASPDDRRWSRRAHVTACP